MTPEEWERISTTWRRIQLTPAAADGAYYEQPKVVRHRQLARASWEEDVYALTSIAAAYTQQWRRDGYHLPMTRLHNQQTT